MKEENLTCIICPNGCQLQVKYNQQEINDLEGALCQRGEEYAEKELFNPERVLTSTVRVTGGNLPLVSVRTDQAVPRERIRELMELVQGLSVKAPVEIGDIIVTSPLALNCNLIATKSVEICQEK